MGFELDHVWCFVDPRLDELNVLRKNGFRVTNGTDHKGQGTSNRSVLFRENYLELLYIRSEFEAKNSPLSLLNRARWKQTGACPFGIALRGAMSFKDRAQFWEYQPAALPGLSIFIHKFNEERPEMPLLFFLQPPAHVLSGTIGPKNWKGLDEELLQHRSGSTKIENLTFVVPNVFAYELESPLPNIMWQSGSSFEMRVKLDGNISRSIELNSLLKMS